eukprot:UN34101
MRTRSYYLYCQQIRRKTKKWMKKKKKDEDKNKEDPELVDKVVPPAAVDLGAALITGQSFHNPIGILIKQIECELHNVNGESNSSCPLYSKNGKIDVEKDDHAQKLFNLVLALTEVLRGTRRLDSLTEDAEEIDVKLPATIIKLSEDQLASTSLGDAFSQVLSLLDL